jgi:hypothetical protein
MSKSSSPVVIPYEDWNTNAVRYMQPKVSDRGSKTINIISTQSNRALNISTPLMMTWGISDFVDEKTGESDGKYSMSLVFPNDQYKKPTTDNFLQKLKDFENQILDDAVKNSEAWFGEEMSRDVAKHTFFPFLKYSKDKVTKKYDYTKPPTIRAKVPNYSGKWAVNIYDTKQNLIFPNDNEHLTPMDFIPKQSNVACALQCGGLWFGGKGWGITWKLTQCIVKPKDIGDNVFSRCHLTLSTDELNAIEKQEIPDVPFDEDEETIPATTTTHVEDSDEEDEPEPAKPVVKKVVKKETAPVAVAVAVETVEAPKKKVIKKKV